MKKVISTILALSLIVGGFKATSYEQVKDGNSYVITADAATTNTEAGKNAGKYSYEFADTSMYTTTFSSVTVGVKDSNGKVTNQTSWEDSVNGNKYGIIRVQVKDNNNKNEVVLDEYRIGLITAKNTNLDVKMSDEVSIPSNVDLSVAKITADTIIGKNATVIAASAFNNSYLKTIDLSGVEFIGANAFQKCQFITEVAIPATVKFVGEGVFGNSGLKKLTVSNDMPVVPAKLCTATKLTEVSFAHPDFIRVIGNNAFSNTPLAAPIFNSWSDISAYEEHIEIEDSAFQNCTSFTGTINVADNIYYLGKNAFSGCSGVKSLIFGKDLTHCDQNCFKGCTSLSSIKFNNCVESLAGGCFQGCSSLLKVEGIPATVYDWVPEDSSVGAGIGDGVFADCTSLQSAVIPRSLTRISQSMFENCTSLTSVTFCNPGGEAVTESPEIVKIKNKAFSNCPKLTAVSYPKAVEIGENAFSGCTGVVSVSIPSSLYIRKNAFSKCTSMTTFKAGECKIVGNNALEGCTSITDITLLADQYGGDEKNSPDATGSTHGYVFKDCTAAKKITIKTSGKVKLSAGLFSGCSALESVGADLSNISVIGKDCFSGCEKLPKVNMPGLVIIEDSGFANCSALKSISDSGNAISAQDYGSRCFQNCSALDIEVTGNISTIGSYAFNKSGVTKVAIDGMVGGTIVIGDSAFGDCEKLASASILSSGVEKFSVGSNVFANCPILTNAVFEGPIITKGMFQNCAGLTKLETTADVFYENAFSGCTKLPQVTKKGDSAAVVAKEINGTAFVNCSALTNSSSDKDTVFKGSGQYKGCSSLASAEVKTLTASMFQNCSNLSKVTLGADVVSVPSYCFQNCSKFADFDFSKITSVGTSAFENTAVKKVSCGSPCTIDSNAFKNCLSLESVSGEMVNIGSNAFNNCSALKEATLKNNSSNPLKMVNSYAFSNCSNLDHITIFGNPTMGANSVGYAGGKKLENFYIAGETDTNVEKYANSNKIPFVDANTGEKPIITTTTTTTKTTTTTTTTTKTTQKPTGNVVYGDANCDGSVDMSDAVIIMQALANPNKYGLNGSDSKHLTEQGRKNGDVDLSSAGITSNDALRIQQYLLKKIASLDPTK